MARKLAINLSWAGVGNRDTVFDAVRAADEGGAHSVWVPEAWGSDAVSLMTQIVERTEHVQVGTVILNIYSRTPSLLAQTFGALDVLSGARMIIGLGTSGTNVIEHFHGVPFRRPLTRMQEYVAIINALIAGEKLDYEGKIFKVHQGFSLGLDLPRRHIPIYIASLTPRSVAQTAQIADGWLPTTTPIQDAAAEVQRFRATAKQAGREPDELTVRAPGTITITRTADVERFRGIAAGRFAFLVASVDVFYSEHLTRLGYGEEVASIKRAWEQGGAAAAAAAVPPDLQQAVGFVTDSIDAARERVAEQEKAEITLHTVDVQLGSLAQARSVFERLLT